MAGCTPADIEVSITDGRVEAIELDEPADLVGLTFSCNNSSHAYRIAAELRSRGVAVVAGGTHTTAVPQEALRKRVEPLEVEWADDRNELLVRAVRGSVKAGYLARGDSVMIVSGSTLEAPGGTSALEILSVEDILDHALE